MTIRENKVIWSWQFETFAKELAEAFKEGWTFVNGSMVSQALPADVHHHSVRERYLAVVEK